jgi:hypothetical protein
VIGTPEAPLTLQEFNRLRSAGVFNRWLYSRAGAEDAHDEFLRDAIQRWSSDPLFVDCMAAAAVRRGWLTRLDAPDDERADEALLWWLGAAFRLMACDFVAGPELVDCLNACPRGPIPDAYLVALVDAWPCLIAAVPFGEFAAFLSLP